MTRQEFLEWLAFYKLDPFGEIREDLRAGILAAAVVNTLRGVHGVKGRQVKPKDFMPTFRRRRMSGDDMKSMLMGYAKQHNAMMRR